MGGAWVHSGVESPPSWTVVLGLPASARAQTPPDSSSVQATKNQTVVPPGVGFQDGGCKLGPVNVMMLPEDRLGPKPDVPRGQVLSWPQEGPTASPGLGAEKAECHSGGAQGPWPGEFLCRSQATPCPPAEKARQILEASATE